MFYTYEAVIRRSREQNRITTGIELVKPHFLLKLSLPFVFNSNFEKKKKILKRISQFLTQSHLQNCDAVIRIPAWFPLLVPRPIFVP